MQDVVRIESGQDPATSDRIREGLAEAFGATIEDMIDYLEGSGRIA
jgi:hypothetical protein